MQWARWATCFVGAAVSASIAGAQELNARPCRSRPESPAPSRPRSSGFRDDAMRRRRTRRADDLRPGGRSMPVWSSTAVIHAAWIRGGIPRGQSSTTFLPEGATRSVRASSGQQSGADALIESVIDPGSRRSKLVDRVRGLGHRPAVKQSRPARPSPAFAASPACIAWRAKIADEVDAAPTRGCEGSCGERDRLSSPIAQRPARDRTISDVGRRPRAAHGDPQRFAIKAFPSWLATGDGDPLHVVTSSRRSAGALYITLPWQRPAPVGILTKHPARRRRSTAASSRNERTARLALVASAGRSDSEHLSRSASDGLQAATRH